MDNEDYIEDDYDTNDTIIGDDEIEDSNDINTENEYSKNISKISASFMITVALIMDLIQAILTFLGVGLIINRLFSACAWITFYLWFKSKNVNFVTPKRYMAMGGAGLIELIPTLDVLPAWTVAVLAILRTTKQDSLNDTQQNNK